MKPSARRPARLCKRRWRRALEVRELHCESSADESAPCVLLLRLVVELVLRLLWPLGAELAGASSSPWEGASTSAPESLSPRVPCSLARLSSSPPSPPAAVPSSSSSGASSSPSRTEAAPCRVLSGRSPLASAVALGAAAMRGAGAGCRMGEGAGETGKDWGGVLPPGHHRGGDGGGIARAGDERGGKMQTPEFKGRSVAMGGAPLASLHEEGDRLV